MPFPLLLSLILSVLLITAPWDHAAPAPQSKRADPAATSGPAPTAMEDLAAAAAQCNQVVSAESQAAVCLDLARKLTTLASQALIRGNLMEAERYSLEALEIQRRLSPNSLELAKSLRLLGSIEEQFGQLAKAEKYTRDALVLAQALSPDGLAVAEAFHRLGNIAVDQGNLENAEEHLQKALEIHAKVDPKSRLVGLILTNLGNLSGRRGDVTKEEKYLQRAQEVGEKLAPIDQAAIFDGLGDVCVQRGNLAEAEQYFRQSLEIRQKLLPDSLVFAVSLSEIGNVTMNRGDPERAEEYYRKALAIRERLAPGSLLVAFSFSGLGGGEQSRGNLAQAERYFHQALKIQQQLAPDSLAEAASLHNLAVLFWIREDLSTAEEYFRRAMEIRQRLAPHSPELAQSFNWLGVLAMRHGDLVQAEQYFREALDISEKASPESLAAAQMLKDLGDIADRRGDRTQAKDYYLKALAIQDKHAPASPAAGFTLQKLGELARESADLAEAERYFRQALAIWEKTAPGGLTHAGTLLSLASLARQEHQPDAALRFYADAMVVLDREMAQLGGTDDVRSVFRAKYEGYYNDYIDLLVKQNQLERAFQVLESSRARTLLEFLESAHVDFTKGADPELLGQERSLQGLIGSKSSYRLRLLERPDTGEQVAALDHDLEELRKQYEEVKTQIWLDSQAYAAFSEVRPLSAMQVQQQLLDENTILLEYSLDDWHSHLWAVTQTSLTVYDLPPRKVVEKAARNVYELLTARSQFVAKESVARRRARLAKANADYPAAASELSQMILGPVATLLEKKRLLIVSDGALQYLPFAVLPTPRLPGSPALTASPGAKDENLSALVIDHEIVNLPSASTLAELRRTRLNRAEPPKTVAVFADPVFDFHDERVPPPERNARHGVLKTIASQSQAEELSLPEQRMARSARDVGLAKNGEVYLSRLLWSEREAAAILNITPAGKGMKALGFKASLATALNRSLAQYRVVHFATHALLDSKNPELSGLVLSLVNQRGKPQDGFLDLEQIYNLKLSADLVVLSACDTALGQEVRGEGLIGLARGFMYAGASRVIASLWSVDDEVTSELMARFYTALERDKMSPAAALRAAQIEVAKDKRWGAPFYWAGFQIQGEWK